MRDATRRCQAELLQVAESLRQSTRQLCRNLKDNPNVAENMAKVAMERQVLQLLLNNTLGEIDVFSKITPAIESVLAQEAAEVGRRTSPETEGGGGDEGNSKTDARVIKALCMCAWPKDKMKSVSAALESCFFEWLILACAYT